MMFFKASSIRTPFSAYLRCFNRTCSRRSALAAAGVLLLTGILCGCSNDFEKQLPNGYLVWNTNSYTTVICRPQGSIANIAVAALVSRIAVHNNLVIGEVVSSPRSEVRDLECVGFFVVDTATGVVKCGMDNAAFEDEVKRLGLVARQIEFVEPEDL